MIPRPRWARLYAIAPAVLVAFALVERAVPPSAPRTALAAGLAAVTFGALARWVRANRPALALLGWCACASETLTVRVIVSRPSWPVRSTTAPAEVAVVAGDRAKAAGATLAV